MKLTIAVLNYHSGYRLKQCLASLLEAPPAVEHEIIVIDNASTDGSADFLKEAVPPTVRFFANDHNLGFTGGYNQAFREAKGELMLLMNADHAARPGAIDAMVRHMDEDASIGGIGGYSLDVNGKFEKYANRFPRPYDVYLNQFVARQKAERNEGFRRYHMMDVDFDGPTEVPQPAGGLYMIRRSLFPDGLMSDAFGIFFSDVEISRKIHDRGFRSMVFPDAPFLHDHNWAKRPVTERSLLVDLDFYVGCARYFRIYDGLGAWLKAKLLITARLSGRLFLVELPAAMRGTQSWRLWRARAMLIVHFLADRNVLLEQERARAAQTA